MPEPMFAVGIQVRLLSRPDRAGKITGVPQFLQGEYWYPVFFGPGQSGRHPESDLEGYTDTFDTLQLLRDQRFAGREAFAKRLTYLKLARALRSHVYALQASRTTFYPYQFKPVLKFLDSWKHRLLIADEVGLGKTIEAGLILTELRARLDLQRVLVVAPSHLLTKWHEELRRRFALDFEIFDRKRAVEFLAKFEREGEETRVRAILSLQSLRGRMLQDRWQAVAPTFDLVIFDEAGRLRNPETLSNRAARTVGEGADAMLLLTATPVQTGERDLFALLNLLDPDDFSDFGVYQRRLAANRHILDAMRFVRGGRHMFGEAAAQLEALRSTEYGRRLAANVLFQDISRRLSDGQESTRRDLVELQRDLNAINLFGHVLSRTRRREIDEQRPLREPVVVECLATPLERDFYDTVTTLCRRSFGRASGNVISAFAAMMPQRQMASCMPAMVQYVKDKRERGDWDVADSESSDLWPELWEDDDEDEVKPGLDWSALGDLDARARELEACDTKWTRLNRVLIEIEREQPGAKVVIFSFFKRTLAYLERRLAACGIPTVLISGDVKTVPGDLEQDERGRRLLRFKEDRAVRVLLSTEVGNEGLDLQFCHVLVNYDLPWNPMVVEQRIGRLDRIGQMSPRIQIFNLTMPGTIEDTILTRLYARVKVFENSIGDLEEILGEVIRDLTMDLFSPKLTPSQQERRIIQAADAVERRRLEQAALEERVGSLIGHDEFFVDEIDRVRDARRFVTGDELLLFVRDYLTAHHPECRMEEMTASLWQIEVGASLRSFVRGRLGAEDSRWFQFQQRTGRGTLRVTTDTMLAQERPDVDLLAFHHPLIAAIASYYAEHSTELHPVSWLEVGSVAVPSGRYVWLLFLTEITGAKPSKDFEFVARRLSDGYMLGPDESDTLLWEMLAGGRSRARGYMPRVDLDQQDIEDAEQTAVHRLNERFARQRDLNDAMVSSRVASLEEAFRRNTAVREERLATARSRGRTQQYLRMLEGGLRKLRATYDMKREEIVDQRRLGRAINLEAAGVVEVHNG